MSECPICRKLTVAEYAPFCSKHCKNVDLIKWLKEDYRIPVQDLDEEEGVLSPEDDEES
jgi:endogenous inhibitor of DNA gyrase (YacG/DUF329 family)